VALRWRAPGRVNLIGEHTDYNAGFALPFALEQGCTATVTPRGDRRVAVRSVQLGAGPDAELADLQPRASGWADYVLGVMWALRQRGFDVPGIDVVVDSDVPDGAGLSSSAALVCSTATAVNDALELRLDGDALLALTRQVENEFVGAPTGGMDQLAALRCTEGAALFCDMRSLATESVPLPLDEHRLIVLDTRAEHRHATGEYRRRREGCEAAARQLGVPALRDVDVRDLDAALARLDDEELQRYTRHIVTENARVLETVARLKAGDVAGIGALLSASHASMRDDFRITIPELDVAAETLEAAGALGARMTGGGFGGCVIALFDDGQADKGLPAVQAAFADRGFAEPVAFFARPSAGAHPVAS
jgi:galactokinase